MVKLENNVVKIYTTAPFPPQTRAFSTIQILRTCTKSIAKSPADVMKHVQKCTSFLSGTDYAPLNTDFDTHHCIIYAPQYLLDIWILILIYKCFKLNL